MKYILQCIKHKDITKQQLDDIIKIKTVAWNYPYERQLTWIDEHIHENDIHCVLLCDNRPVAYMNLIDTWMCIDGEKISIWGVGNVCSIEKGMGYGKELMEKVNSFILAQSKVGLLFCRDKLVSFYIKFGWNLVNPLQIEGIDSLNYINVMLFNLNCQYGNLKYSNPLF